MDEYKRLSHVKIDKFEVELALGKDRMLPYGVRVKHEYFNEGDWIYIAWVQYEVIAYKIFDDWVERLKAGKMDYLVDVYTGKVHRRNVD